MKTESEKTAAAETETAEKNGKGGMPGSVPAPKDEKDGKERKERKEKKRAAVLMAAAVLLVLLLAAGAVISLLNRGEKEKGIVGTWVPDKAVSGAEGAPAGTAEESNSVSADGMNCESPATQGKNAVQRSSSVSADGANHELSAAPWDHAGERVLSLKKDGTYVLSSPAGTGETVHSGTWSFSGTELTLRRRVADGTLTAADLGGTEQGIAILPDENGTFLMTGGGRELSGGYQMIGAGEKDVTAPLLLKGTADESGAARFTWGDTAGNCRFIDGSLILYPDDEPAAHFLRLDGNERVFTMAADGAFTLTEGGDEITGRGTWQAVQDGWCFTFNNETDDKAEGKTEKTAEEKAEQQSEKKEAKSLTVTLSENGGYTDSTGRTGTWEAEDRTVVMMLQNVTVTGVFGCTLQEDTLLLCPLSLPDEGMGTPAETTGPWIYRRK